MSTRHLHVVSLPAVLALCVAGAPLVAQAPPASQLPALAPTQAGQSNITSPLSAVASPDNRPGEQPHSAQVHCEGGLLEIRADNSSLNSILRAIARCTGMRITGGVPEQRVFGNYGPAAPAAVLATLIDGTGSNMLLQETEANQPAELILTPRTGGATPPPPSSYADADTGNAAPGQPTQPAMQPDQQPIGMRGRQLMGVPPGSQTPVPQPTTGSAVTSPPSMPQPLNNVNGSPNNTSPTASTYPTTNSVPLDSLPTPSTTPSADGIVDAPNPPPAGSDTAAAMSGAPRGTPGTTNINPGATSQTTTPGATNTTLPATPNQSQTSPAPTTDLTPEQIFSQLQQRQQRQQQQQQQQPQPQDNPQ